MSLIGWVVANPPSREYKLWRLACPQTIEIKVYHFLHIVFWGGEIVHIVINTWPCDADDVPLSNREAAVII